MKTRKVIKTNNKNTQTGRIPDSRKTNNTNYFDIFQPVCNSQNCPLPYAYCNAQTNCHCSEGYANFKKSNDSNKLPCQYVQKKQLNAFLLEAIFPFGIGHFYSKRSINGLLKILFVFATPCLLCCLVCCGIVTMDSLFSQKLFAGLSAVLGIIYTLGCIAWLIVDLVFFGLNKYSDGSGVPLQGW